MSERVRAWCFTINNYTDVDEQRLSHLAEDGGCTYLVFGRERGGVTGTPHLQGFIYLLHAKTRAAVKRLVGERSHLERARGTPAQAAAYCKKEGDYEEFGQAPAGAGARTDLDRFVEWVKSRDTRPSESEVIRMWGSLWLRSGSRLFDVIDAHLPRPRLVPEVVTLQAWQQDLVASLSVESDDRKIMFYIDPVGNTGKSFMCRYLLSERDDVQVLKIGKRDDLAHCVDPSKSVFLVDVPRSQMELLQYSVLEMLKDRMVFSPKYHSRTKILSTTPYVVVFCNEDPDMTKLSEDRYDVHYI